MKIRIIFLMVLITSCSGNQKSGPILETEDLYKEIEKEYSDISDNDFKSPPLVLYNAGQDSYRAEVRVDDTLSAESLVKAPDATVVQFSQSKDGPTKMAALCYQKEFEAAKKLFEVLYKGHRKNPSYWNQIGTCYYLEGKRSRAEIFYNKAIGLSNKYAPSYNNLGVIYFGEGRYNKALVAFQTAYDINSYSLTPIFNLASVHLQFGNFKKAQQLFKVLYQQRNQDNDVINALAYSALFEGDFKEALYYFSKLEKSYLQKESPSLGLAYTYYHLDKKEDSRKIMYFLGKSSVKNKKMYDGLSKALGI